MKIPESTNTAGMSIDEEAGKNLLSTKKKARIPVADVKIATAFISRSFLRVAKLLSFIIESKLSLFNFAHDSHEHLTPC